MPIPTDFVSANSRMLEAYAALAPTLAATEPAAFGQLTTIMAGVIPPERVSEFAEWGYAKRDLLDAPAKEAVADVCAFATMNGFYGLGENQRGARIEAMLRQGSLPKGTEAPEPSNKFAVAAPAAPTAALVGEGQP